MANEKLIKLLDNFTHNVSPYAGDSKYFMVDDNRELADHLIANDVVPVVRCKDCKCFEKMASNNSYFCNVYGGYVKEKDYCSRAQPKRGRREGE